VEAVIDKRWIVDININPYKYKQNPLLLHNFTLHTLIISRFNTYIFCSDDGWQKHTPHTSYRTSRNSHISSCYDSIQD